MKKIKLLKKIIPLAIGTCLIFTGCASNSSKDKTTVQTIKLGLSPDEDAAAVLKKYDPLIQYLNEVTGLKIEPYVGADYTAVIEALNGGNLDVAWFGPSEYVLASDVVERGVEVFATAVQSEGTVPYKSSLIVSGDSDINSLADVEGRTISFTDPASTSGHLFARYSLVQAGVQPEQHFKQVIYSGSHDACLLAVTNGQVDVAAVSSRKIPGFVESGLIKEGDIKIVFESEEIPSDALTFRADLNEELKAKIAEAFLVDSDELRAVLDGTGFAKFEETDNNKYEIVKEAYRIAGLKPEL